MPESEQLELDGKQPMLKDADAQKRDVYQYAIQADALEFDAVQVKEQRELDGKQPMLKDADAQRRDALE